MARIIRAESRPPMRERLLAAARDAFLSEGYAGASLADIALRAGDAKGEIYSSYPSKEAVFLELLSIRLDADIAELQKLADESASADALLAGVRRHLEAHEDILDFSLVAAEFFQQLHRDSPSAQACANLYRRQRRALAELLRALPQWKRHEADLADDVAAALVGLTFGFAVQRGMERKAATARLWARVVVGYLAGLIADA